ncbi:unnamed protein product [Knipowitschia caucasica]
MASVRDVCLTVLCGLPAVGKSTLCRRLRGSLAGQEWSFVTASYDELIPKEAFVIRALEEDEDQHTEWKQHRQSVLNSIERFVDGSCSDASVCDSTNKILWERSVRNLLEQASLRAAPVVFLLDDNFYYRSMRYEVYQLARKHSLGFCQIFLTCDPETCRRRNQQRAEPVAAAVMEVMEQRLQPPGPQRHEWERTSLMLQTDQDLSEAHIQSVVDLISFALKNKPSPVEDDTEQKQADREACANSVVHQADQTCRKLISEAMKTARGQKVTPSSLRSLASELSGLKSEFLQGLKARLLLDSALCTDAAEAAFERQKEEVLRRVLETPR